MGNVLSEAGTCQDMGRVSALKPIRVRLAYLRVCGAPASQRTNAKRPTPTNESATKR